VSRGHEARLDLEGPKLGRPSSVDAHAREDSRLPRMPHSPEGLAELLAGARHAVVLTGAGISTESGIPDFRSAGGLWERYDPMEVGSLTSFVTDPARFWSFHRPRIDSLADVEPNDAHRVVAELQRRGVVKAVVTQNIDRLHSRAGSTEVIEVHGALDRGSCLRCGAAVSMDELVARADAAEDGVPRCGCGYQLKSGVVLFGEGLPPEAIGAAYDAAERADVMLVIGSSLLVAPVSELPGVVLRRGGRLAILTESETPYDAVAHVRLHTRAGPTLSSTLAALDRLAA
jgi:NAD-dependent deacetylase